MSTFNIDDLTLSMNKIYRLLAGYPNVTLSVESILSTQAINTTFSVIIVEGTSQSYHFDIDYDPSGLFTTVHDAGTHVGHTTFTHNIQITGAISAGTYPIGITTKDYVGRTFTKYFHIIVT